MEQGMMKVLGPTQNVFIISLMFLHLFNPFANVSIPVELLRYKPGMFEKFEDFV
jgi:hypothetical protein